METNFSKPCDKELEHKNQGIDDLKKIAPPLFDRIQQLEQWYGDLPGTEKFPKIAVFDLDNTLLIGDVGDAVFALLKNKEQISPLTVDGHLIPLTWKLYREIYQQEGREAAYSTIVKVMAGLPLKTLIDLSLEVMALETPFLELEGVHIPVPRPQRVMTALLSLLKSLEYDIFVISASNCFTVKKVAARYFQLPEDHVFGITPRLEKMKGNKEEILTAELIPPVTVVQGKVEAYHRYIGMTAPLISGGDSLTDIPMLNLTHPQGTIIWVGENEKGLMEIESSIRHPQRLFFLKRLAS